MALGDSYATLTELKRYLLGQVQAGVDTLDDAELTAALASASREIEHFCGRQFNAAGVASSRAFRLTSPTIARVDDFTAPDTVTTDDDDDGVFETTWAAADYQLEPLNGVVDGESGWPYWRIRAVSTRLFPVHNRRASLQVVGNWGWAAVPAPVKQATLILAAETHKMRSAPFGVAGFGEFGVVRVRSNPIAAKLLMPYQLRPVLVA